MVNLANTAAAIRRSNVAEALQSPKGIITVNCHKPFPVENAVFSLGFGSSCTCQYLLATS